MRVLPFTKYSPCGNTTILVRESSLSPADRARVAAEIIAPGHLEAEQAGYVDTAAPVPRLDMMGGEFCVNATRAFAALLAEEGKLSPESGGLGGIVSVSGMPERLRVRVRRLAAHRFESAVLLDLPQAPPLENVAPGMYLVRVPGIAHLVLDAAAHPLPADKDRDTAALFVRFGLIFHSITTGASNDIEQATKLARAMISRYGMSEDFDMVAMENVTNQYLGGDSSLSCSFETQTLLDKKVVELVRTEHQKALKILQDNIGKLHELAKYLYEHETITGEEFMKILNAPLETPKAVVLEKSQTKSEENSENTEN